MSPPKNKPDTNIPSTVAGERITRTQHTTAQPFVSVAKTVIADIPPAKITQQDTAQPFVVPTPQPQPAPEPPKK